MSGLANYDESDFESFLTNQKLSDRFKSRFDLVLFSIELAKKAVRSGYGKVVVGNLSYEVLKDLYNKKMDINDPIVNVSKSRKVLSKTSKRSGSSSKYRNKLDIDFPNELA